MVLAPLAGSGAIAAQPIGTAEAANSGFHFEGDADEVAADVDKDAPHHHNVCHADCAAIPVKVTVLPVISLNAGGLLPGRVSSLTGARLHNLLRPPIA